MTPRIVDRAEWGARPPRGIGVTRPLEVLQGLVVHHEGIAVDHDAEPSELVRAVQRWHQDGNGWADIAYNTLIWHDGTVFLGRDAGVRGAHTVAPGAHDWNWTHLGVCLLGSGDDTGNVTDDAWRSILWCWQLGAYISGGRATGFLTHRETGSPTHCAGDALQARMDGLRAFLAGLNQGAAA